MPGAAGRRRRIWTRLCDRLPIADLESLELAWAVAALSHYFPQAQGSRRGGKRGSDAGRAPAWPPASRLRPVPRLCSAPGFAAAAEARRDPGLPDLPGARPRESSARRSTGVTRSMLRGDVATTLVCLQGPLGQWWWKYRCRVGQGHRRVPRLPRESGRVGSCRAAVAVASRAAGPLPRAVARGFAWECGANEPGLPLIDDDAGCIARSVEPDGDRWRVSWDWFSYHPARAVVALTEVGELMGLGGAELRAAGSEEAAGMAREPVCVVVGLHNNGLAVVRALGRQGVRVIAIDTAPPTHYARTRFAKVVPCADLKGLGFVEQLRTLGRRVRPARRARPHDGPQRDDSSPSTGRRLSPLSPLAAGRTNWSCAS